MPPDQIRQLLLRKPFEPFRLYVLETTTYEIERPEWVILGKAVVLLYFPAAGQFPSAWRRRVVIALLHVSKLELIEPPVGSGNGQAGQGAPA
jgi:hypothetical protein